jgi:hypothetical protein
VADHPESRAVPPRPRSVAARLARRAVAAGRAAELRERLAARPARGSTSTASLVLLALLAQAEGNQDAATSALDALGKQLQNNPLQASAELACHAAIPPLAGAPGSAETAAAILARAAGAFATGEAGEPLGTLLLTLARFRLGRGDVAAGRKHLDEFLGAAERATSRPGGDPLDRRKGAYEAVASELLAAGRWADALDALGPLADASGSGSETAGRAIAAVARLAARSPAAERFERLRAWTLPTSARRSVRVLAGLVPDGVADTASLLIAAARDAGKLDALADEARALADQDVENARALLVLVGSAQGRGASVEPSARAVAGRAQSAAAATTPGPARAGSPAWSDVLTARACLADPALGAVGESMALDLIARSRRVEAPAFEGLLTRDLVASRARAASGGPAPLPRDPGLALWRADDPTDPVSGPGLWVEHEDYVQRVGPPGDDRLHFAAPMAGTFAFSVDAFLGDGFGVSLAYGGIVFDPDTPAPERPSRHGGQVRTLGPVETLSRPSPFVRPEAFNRLTVQAEPGKVRFLVNGHLFYETDRVGPTTRWLSLGPGKSARTVVRNLTLSGRPAVPREVRLVEGDRLDGWLTVIPGETQPPGRRLREGQPERDETAPPVEGDAHDWSAQGGQILGRRDDSPAGFEPAPSALVFHRPLGDGEEIRYAFDYEPGQTLVHPALGRLIFRLEPGGVRLYRIADRLDADVSPRIASHEPDRPRGGEPLPLRPGEGNTMTLRLADGRVTLVLNGATVHEGPFDPTGGRRFGFYHDKDRTDARVRDVVLRGDWPESFADGPLTRPAERGGQDPGRPARRARHAEIGEALLSAQAGPLLDQTRGLPAPARLERLAAWVLPGDDHPGFRLQGDFAPAERPSSGGTLRAPALALVEAAHELGRLDALADRVE